MSNEQKHPKLLCDHPVRVSQEQSSSAIPVVRRHLAILEEISRGSATLYTECPVRAGSHIAIDCANCKLRGKIVGCEQRAGAEGYTAAVELDADSQWSRERFVPDWLLNPNYLSCERADCRPDCDRPECCGGSRSDLEVRL